MTGDGLEISSQRTGTIVRIVAVGEIDLATASRLRDHTRFHLADHAEIVVLDLTQVTFLDSSGLYALLQTAQADPHRLRILPGAACLRLFDIAGVRDELPLLDAEPLS